MQTFLPYPNLYESVAALDNQRLGKQRVEALQIYQALTEGSRWENHPAVHMWRGYEHVLAMYHNICIEEWVRRKFNNNMEMLPTSPLPHSQWRVYRTGPFPWWFGRKELHDSHKSNLLRKDPKYYQEFDLQGIPFNYLYLWPMPESKTFRLVVPDWALDGDFHIPALSMGCSYQLPTKRRQLNLVLPKLAIVR